MRPTCPRCNSIQTKYKSSKPLLMLLEFHKCKNCGYEFVPKTEKKKSGCLGSFFKIIFTAILFLLFLGWLFSDDAPQKSSKTTETKNIAWEPKQDTQKEVNIEDAKKIETQVESEEENIANNQESIENSQDMSDTLNIKTVVREAE